MSSSPTKLRRSDFGYEVPDALVAQQPMAERDRSRLLVRQANGALEHCIVSDLISELPSGTLLIFNDSRVIPGRLLGNLETGGRIEVFLLKRLSQPHRWEALGKPLKKLKVGTRVLFARDMVGRCVERLDDRIVMEFDDGFDHWLNENGFIPLPPYIRRSDPLPASASDDREIYQTVYARESGSVAAPTAGLHFTRDLMNRLQERGVDLASICLHVGGGTFLPVKEDDLDAHPMHEESYLVPRETFEKILDAKRAGRPIVAVGTTTLRCLESFALISDRNEDRMLEASDRWHSTDLFVRPHQRDDRYKPWAIDGLMTNFHQPYSTLLMLICALVGYEETLAMYRAAIDEGYRLFSYGDSSLLWLTPR